MQLEQDLGITKRPSFYFAKMKPPIVGDDGIVISRPAVGGLNYSDAEKTGGRTRTDTLIEINQRNQSLDPKSTSRDRSNSLIMLTAGTNFCFKIIVLMNLTFNIAANTPVSNSWWSKLVVAIVGNQAFKVNEKVEPKTFLANERTFLAWLDMSVTLAAISVAILSMSEINKSSLLYGIILLPVAIGFSIYSLTLYLSVSWIFMHCMIIITFILFMFIYRGILS